jgi:hypothetical protein
VVICCTILLDEKTLVSNFLCLFSGVVSRSIYELRVNTWNQYICEPCSITVRWPYVGHILKNFNTLWLISIKVFLSVSITGTFYVIMNLLDVHI